MNNYQKAQRERWSNMTPEKKKETVGKMQAGRKKKRRRRKLSSKTTTARLNNTFEVAKKLAEVMALAGGREQVIRLMDVVELVIEEEVK